MTAAAAAAAVSVATPMIVPSGLLRFFRLCSSASTVRESTASVGLGGDGLSDQVVHECTPRVADRASSWVRSVCSARESWLRTVDSEQSSTCAISASEQSS